MDEISNIEKKIKGILVNAFPIFFKKKKHIGILSLCAYRIENEYAKEIMDKYVVINDKKHEVNMLFKRGIKFLRYKKFTYFFNIYSVKFDMEFLKTCPIQNGVRVIFAKGDVEVRMPVVYNVIHLKRNLH